LRPSNIPAAIALIVFVIAGYFVDQQSRTVEMERLRGEVLSRVSVIRAKLEGNINGNLQLMRGLVAAIAANPDMTPAEYSQLARNLLENGPQIRNIADAPDLVVTMVYPHGENDKVIGLDYRQRPAQREAALHARDTGQLIFAGPVNLVQGGQGFIGRFPVFVEADGKRRFWGLVSGAVDLESLYRDSGLSGTSTLDIALTGRDGKGSQGELFYGSPDVVNDDPVVATVMLPSGSWLISARPKGGWDAHAGDVFTVRLLIVLAGVLVLVPIIIAGRLMDDRQRYIQAL